MARRRKDAEITKFLMGLPWQASMATGSIVFVALYWMIPAVLKRNPFLHLLIPLAQSMAWLALLVCACIALLSFLRAQAAGADRLSDLACATSSPSQPLPFGEPTTLFKSIDQWTLQALRELEWKRFELLCAKYYEAVGFKCATVQCGPDGGIDIKLFKNEPVEPIAIVQCKAWNSAVGVKEVRELLGVMAHEKVGRGIFITTGAYTKEALEFGKANPLQLLDGDGFLKKLEQLPKDKLATLLAFAFDGDYTTPTCASCGIKMIRRESRRGPFWGCKNHPRCGSTFAIKG